MGVESERAVVVVVCRHVSCVVPCGWASLCVRRHSLFENERESVVVDLGWSG